MKNQKSNTAFKKLVSVVLLVALTYSLGGFVAQYYKPFAQAAPEAVAENNLIANNSVDAVVTDGTTTYIGGAFTAIGPNSFYAAPVNQTTGEVIADFPEINGPVRVLEPDGSGGWYLAGEFTEVDGQDFPYLAHLNSDLTLDETWEPYPDSFVYSLVISGSDIYVGGIFSNIGGQARNNIAKLNNTNGNADGTWNPNANNTVNTIAITGSDVYAGGTFTTIGGQTRNRIAKLNNTNGNADGTWNANSDAAVNIITITGSDIYVGGGFANIGGQARNRIAKLNNTNGNADGTWNASVNGHGSTHVNSIKISGSDIYAAGYFNGSAGGQTRTRAVKLNTTNGNADTTWNPNFEFSISTNYLGLDDDIVYLSSHDTNFVYANSGTRLAAIDNSTGELTDWAPEADEQILTMAMDDNFVYIGGYFSEINSVSVSSIVRIDKVTGELDETWLPDVSGTDASALTVTDDYVYVGVPDNNPGAYRLNKATAELDETWTPAPDSTVYAIEVYGSNVYLGGDFSEVGGEEIDYLAKVDDATGIADTDFSFIPYDPVRDILIDNGNLYAASTYFEETDRSVIKIDLATDQIDLTWIPETTDSIYSLAIIGDKLFIAGELSSINGDDHAVVGAVDTVTGQEDEWAPISSGDYGYLAASDNVLIVGGAFDIDGDFTYDYLARFTFPEIQFESPSASSDEETSSTSFTIELSEEADLDTNVTYTVSGTATGGGADYTLSSGTATIDEGDTSATVPITIANDELPELDETIVVTLSLPRNSVLGDNSTFTYTIIDVDTTTTSGSSTQTQNPVIPPVVPSSSGNNFILGDLLKFPAKIVFYEGMGLGTIGDTVKTLQQLLNHLGYPLASSGAGAPGQETTYFGTRTQGSLIKLQTAFSQSVNNINGYVDNSTANLLNLLYN